MSEFHHVPVLLDECLEGLAIRPNGDYLDCTLGGAGHSSEILARLSAEGSLTGIDRDWEALHAAEARLQALQAPGRFCVIHGNFHEADALTEGRKFDGILADLGVSSHQLDARERGFSYHDDAPLDMRMDASTGPTAADLLATLSEDEITRILLDYSEEHWARQIARVICDRRKVQPITTTAQLVDAIDAAIPQKVRQKDGSHPARRTFQALRIAVNDELQPLDAAMRSLAGLLKPGGHLCVITFHSLEDRLVKNAFRTMENPCTCPKRFPVCVCGKKPVVRVLTRKPILASDEELARNPRARSASLRIAEKLPD